MGRTGKEVIAMMIRKETVDQIVEQSVELSGLCGHPVVVQLGEPTKKQVGFGKLSIKGVNVRLFSLDSDTLYGFQLDKNQEGETIVWDWSPSFAKRMKARVGTQVPTKTMDRVIEMAETMRKNDSLQKEFVKAEREKAIWRMTVGKVKAALGLGREIEDAADSVETA